MDEDKVVHSGLLSLPPNSKLSLKKTWQQKFCMLYQASKLGIERLEVYDGIDDARKNAPCKIITLENCIKVMKKGQTFFTIVTKSGVYEFSTASENHLNEWINALQKVAFTDNTSPKTTSLVEDNDLYCSTGEGIFSVKLCETDASIRCNLEPKFYILALTPTAIQLRDIQSDKLLFTWPYQFIRRYGYSNGRFTFEAGRKCDSGEGKFLLEHSNEQEVFRYLIMKMKSMKKLLKSESINSLDCGDHDKHFQTVLNMEARSRSPLPASLISSTTLLHDLETVSGEFAEKMLLVKAAPQKPPRKNIPVQPKDDYETISKYDEIEFRDNAWKTLGTTDVMHEEENLEGDYFSWERSLPAAPKSFSTTASKVIKESADDYDDSELQSYDKLNFFGSSNKLNVEGRYKLVRGINTNAQQQQPSKASAVNEYDEVHTFQAIRQADDSHLGYAVIRKKETQVNHKSFNDTEYAIISKPKRV